MPNSMKIFITSEDGDTMGGRISRAREAMELKVSEVANQLGVKKETVSAWERDRSEPRTNRLYMLAGILGVSPIWLISGGGVGGVNDNETAANKASKAQIEALLEIRRLHAATGKAIEALERQIQA